MFEGGAIPGILIGLAYIIIIRLNVKKRNLPRSIERFDGKDLLKKFVKAIPALLVPFIMVFGITAGVFYLIAGLLGLGNVGTFADLQIWSWMCIIFGIIFVFGSIFFMKGKKA